MKPSKLLIFILILIPVVATLSAWGATSATTSSLPITVEGTGKIAQISSSGPVTVTVGGAELVSGIELYRIDMGSARFSDLAKIHILLLDPEDMGKVLNNPQAYIDVGVWYPDSGGSQVLSNGTKVARDENPRASARMSQKVRDVLLLPSRAMQGTLYVLASIVTPQDNPKGETEKPEKAEKPDIPGLQQQLELRFFCEVRV